MPLSAVAGHVHLIALLRTAVARDRVPQSLLFAGPEGVGKRTTATALAQAVNCSSRRAAKQAGAERANGNDRASRAELGGGAPARQHAGGPGATPPDKNDACGECVACVRIARGQHTDVVVVDKGDEASIKIKVIRERLLEQAGYRPFEGRRRVFIVDGAEDLTHEAQAALLKTLEEPPAGAMFILVSAYPDALLPTVQSRCRRLRFGLLTDQEVARVLTERAGVDASTARLMAAGSGGSVSRALAEAAGDLAGDRDAALSLLRAAAGRPILPRLKAAAGFAQHDPKREDRRAREKLAARLTQAASLCRDLAALHAGAQDVIVNADLGTALHELSRAFGPDRLSRAYDVIERGQRALERNGNPKLVADWVGTAI